jgi:hypothetical protein
MVFLKGFGLAIDEAIIVDWKPTLEVEIGSLVLKKTVILFSSKLFAL